jgi:hypothetical protein
MLQQAYIVLFVPTLVLAKIELPGNLRSHARSVLTRLGRISAFISLDSY